MHLQITCRMHHLKPPAGGSKDVVNQLRTEGGT